MTRKPIPRPKKPAPDTRDKLTLWVTLMVSKIGRASCRERVYVLV